ncbi:MAG: DUF1127 domain-containing protein [Brevirhabdus sp.]
MHKNIVVATKPLPYIAVRDEQSASAIFMRKEIDMAAFDATRANGAGLSFGGRMTTTFNTLFGAVIAWNDTRITRKALSQLSDRELEDIGLNRGDIAEL